MADTFQLEIVTPTKLLVKEAAEEAQIPGASGYLGILPGHAPLITELGVGAITYKASGGTHKSPSRVGRWKCYPTKLRFWQRPPNIGRKSMCLGRKRPRGGPKSGSRVTIRRLISRGPEIHCGERKRDWTSPKRSDSAESATPLEEETECSKLRENGL